LAPVAVPANRPTATPILAISVLDEFS